MDVDAPENPAEASEGRGACGAKAAGPLCLEGGAAPQAVVNVVPRGVTEGACGGGAIPDVGEAGWGPQGTRLEDRCCAA